MTILGRIFGSDSVVEKAAEGIYHGVDKAIYTDEEKATGFLALLKAYEPFKLAQRVLAFMLIGAYLFTWLVVVLLFTSAGILDTTSLHTAATNLAAQNNETLGLAVSLVVTFYYGGGALEGVVSRFKNK